MIKQRIKEICRILQEQFEWAIEYHTDSNEVLTYAESRGITLDNFKKFKLGYCYKNILNVFKKPETMNRLAPYYKGTLFKDVADFEEAIVRDLERIGIVNESARGYFSKFAGRLMFPIFDEEGDIVSFAGRKIREEFENAPKYYNGNTTAAYQKSKILYGIQQFSKTDKMLPFILINEGYLDTIALSRIRYDCNVALCGTACTEQHLKMLFEKTDSLLFNLDGDDAGYNAAIKSVLNALPLLTGKRQVKVVFNEDGSDPDSIITNRTREMVDALGDDEAVNDENVLNRIFKEIRSEYSQSLKAKAIGIIDVLTMAAQKNNPNSLALQIKELEGYCMRIPSGSHSRNQVTTRILLMEEMIKESPEVIANKVIEASESYRPQVSL